MDDDNNDKLRVTLNIAEEQVKTVINRNDEEELRRVERAVTDLWRKWQAADPTKTKTQVLAMVAFQFAKLYADEKAASQKREASLQEFMRVYEEKLNKIVLKV